MIFPSLIFIDVLFDFMTPGVAEVTIAIEAFTVRTVV